MKVQILGARDQQIKSIIAALKIATKGMQEPMSVILVREYGPDPFLVLISCLLSLRSKDVATLPIVRQLWAKARTPEQICNLSLPVLERLFYSIGFYRQKARTIKSVACDILKRFGGEVPSQMDQLLSIKGVGRKTANLVRGAGFGIPSICVDVHVHRISNRLGIINTRTPQQTEFELMRIIPKEDWIVFNHLLVMWGQNVCTPRSPFCSRCAIRDLCKRIGVHASR